jgi:hypothetical protein
MNGAAFAVLTLVSFLAPVPLIAWLDRPRKAR